MEKQRLAKNLALKKIYFFVEKEEKFVFYDLLHVLIREKSAMLLQVLKKPAIQLQNVSLVLHVFFELIQHFPVVEKNYFLVELLEERKREVGLRQKFELNIFVYVPNFLAVQELALYFSQPALENLGYFQVARNYADVILFRENYLVCVLEVRNQAERAFTEYFLALFFQVSFVDFLPERENVVLFYWRPFLRGAQNVYEVDDVVCFVLHRSRRQQKTVN
jgi:hypothetical protein